MSLLGFPLLRFIDLQDSEAIIHALQATDPDVPIDLVLHTPGGLVLSASQIARASVSTTISTGNSGRPSIRRATSSRPGAVPKSGIDGQT